MLDTRSLNEANTYGGLPTRQWTSTAPTRNRALLQLSARSGTSPNASPVEAHHSPPVPAQLERMTHRPVPKDPGAHPAGATTVPVVGARHRSVQIELPPGAEPRRGSPPQGTPPAAGHSGPWQVGVRWPGSPGHASSMSDETVVQLTTPRGRRAAQNDVNSPLLFPGTSVFSEDAPSERSRAIRGAPAEPSSSHSTVATKIEARRDLEAAGTLQDASPRHAMVRAAGLLRDRSAKLLVGTRDIRVSCPFFISVHEFIFCQVFGPHHFFLVQYCSNMTVLPSTQDSSSPAELMDCHHSIPNEGYNPGTSYSLRERAERLSHHQSHSKHNENGDIQKDHLRQGPHHRYHHHHTYHQHEDSVVGSTCTPSLSSAGSSQNSPRLFSSPGASPREIETRVL